MMKSKTIEQLEHEKLHYLKSYHRAKAKGKVVVRWQIRKLSQKLKSFRNGFELTESTAQEIQITDILVVCLGKSNYDR